MNTKALVLLSGGLDSVYNLYAANEKWPGQVEALLFNYGQKAWENEKLAATYFADNLRVPTQTLDISNVFENDESSLTSSANSVPTDDVDIESMDASIQSAQKVWVSNRNGVFLNVAACVAEKKGAQFIVPGFNSEEAATFPDNSVEYIEKMNACLQMSTANGVQVYCFSQEMDKKQIIKAAKNLKVNIDKIWSCYHHGESICGRCESCQRFLRAKSFLN